ncbi:MAG TPA: DUF4097 family beta strand repeat-containing protein [Polyangia bacterium]|nr:DUF4097 family beta strand repeat-containing protein [Polyangia bacterium]
MQLLVLATVTAAQLPQSWSFKTGPTPTVNVANILGPITVEGVSGETVTVEATVSGGTDAERARWSVEVVGDGGSVHARVCCGSSCTAGGGQGDRCNDGVLVKLTLRVPKGSRLEAHGVSSVVAARGVSTVHAHSVSGNVRVAAAADVEADTVSGHVEVRDAAGPARVRTVSGDASVSSASSAPRLELHSVSGRLEFAGVCADGCRVTAHTTSGDLRLQMAPASGFDLRFQSQSGDLHDELSMATKSRRHFVGTEVEARYGKGGGNIEVTSVSGDLEVKKR